MKSWIAGIFAVMIILWLPFRPLTNSQIRSSVVQLMGEDGACTGEQVRGKSGKLYILTAGHCIQDKLVAITESGRKQKIRFVYESKRADLALYTPVAGIPPLVVRYPTFHGYVRIFSHGLRHATYISEGEMLESGMMDIDIPDKTVESCKGPKYKANIGLWPSCSLHTITLTTTAWAVPGSSGGPAVDSFGNLVGVVSGGNDHFTYLVPSWDVYKLLKNF